MSHDTYRCHGCRLNFPLKQLKRCGGCRIPVYCSVTCQKASWKGGHKELCREVVVEKKLLNGWSRLWDEFLGWTTTRAMDLPNRPGINRNHCLEIKLRKTGSNDVRRAYEVLSGRVQVMDMDDVVFHERDSRVAEENLHNRLHLNLLVQGKGGRLIDATGLAWILPDSIPDTPERSSVQARYCVEVLKSVLRNSKPRNAVRDGTLAMETAIMREGLRPAFPIP